MLKDELVVPLVTEISRLRMQARNATPSNMSDATFNDCDVFPDNLIFPGYPVPQLAADDRDGHAIVDEIKKLLTAARAQGSKGSEYADRVHVIDPFFVDVAALFNMDCWNKDSEENLLVLHDLSIDEPKRTTGWIDKVVTIHDTTRARLLGWEIKAIV